MEELLKKIDLFQDILNKLKLEAQDKMKSTSFAQVTNVDELDNIRSLINSPDWPVAVDPDLLCNESSDSEKMERAEGIRDIFLDTKFDDKKVLDFGCGEGHLTKAISDKNTKFIVGFDCYLNKPVEIDKSKGMYTHDWNTVIENGPYDIVVMYDILDHLEKMSMVECFQKIFNVTSKFGTIYLRIHPFIARHGGHAYNKLNKAFIHLFLTEGELKYFYPDIKNYPTSKIIHPIVEYKKSLMSTKFTEKNMRIIDQPIEDYFKKPEIANRIKKNMGLTSYPTPQMNIQFIDVILQKFVD